MKSTTVLVTGAAGFIGFHLSKRLLDAGHTVVGYDVVNDYYDPTLKEDRLKQLAAYEGFTMVRADLQDQAAVNATFEKHAPTHVVNLAAQAGVRYSLEHPHAYTQSNVTGFLNILEASRHYQVQHLVYASSSSVYGANTAFPFAVENNVDHPISLYAATKKANELMAHTYSALFKVPTTGLRFFTVYGPWGRPDMALFLFTKAILEGEPIKVFNYGKMMRDFTYIDDIVEGVFRLLWNTPTPDEQWSGDDPNPATSFAPYRLYNIGNNTPVQLSRFIELIEENLGKKAEKELLPLQPGDVSQTYADVDALMKAVDFRPNTSIETGIANFINWYKEYYKVG